MKVVSNEGPVQRRAFSDWALLHSPSLEETGIRGVPLGIGGIALFGGIHLAFVFAISLLISALSPVPWCLRLAGGTGGISL